jgi:hypothetical protein
MRYNGSMDTDNIITGDCLDVLTTMPADVVESEAKTYWHRRKPDEREDMVYAKALGLIQHFGFGDLAEEAAAIRGSDDEPARRQLFRFDAELVSRSSDLGQFLRHAEVVADIDHIRHAAGKFWLTLTVWGKAGDRAAAPSTAKGRHRLRAGEAQEEAGHLMQGRRLRAGRLTGRRHVGTVVDRRQGHKANGSRPEVPPG